MNSTDVGWMPFVVSWIANREYEAEKTKMLKLFQTYPGPLFEWMRKNEFRYHTMADIERRGFDAVMEDVIREANDGPEYIFISFDIDTLDPAFVPGTGTPEPGGLTPREAFPIVRRLCADSNVVGL